MMKKCIYIVLAMMAVSCTSFENSDPFTDSLNTISVTVVYPSGYEDNAHEGTAVQFEDIDKGNEYTAYTDVSGKASGRLPNGIYRISVSTRSTDYIFNGTADNIRLIDRDLSVDVNLVSSKAGTLIIKEIYCGGCMKTPAEGTYQYDSYVIVHNNDSEVHYLDNVCFATLDPYNATASNVWVTQDPSTGASIYPDFMPVIQALWEFPGDGTTFPLAPGEDAVICVYGAIDHTQQYPLSIDLNKSDYFVCYDPVNFPNTTYHPAPGDQIRPDHYMKDVIKLGQATAFTFSVSSPAVIIFKAEGTTIEEFVESPDNVVQKPGSTYDRIVKVPEDWILDGVEVFNGGSSNNKKRMSPAVDAGYVTQSASYLGHTLFRYVDEEASMGAGYEVLCDTNNSSTDLYEREQQSLHD